MTTLLTRIQNRRNRDAFTLIEVLVATVIVGILAAIGYPAVLANQQAGHDDSVRANIVSYSTAMADYRVVYGITAKPSIHIPVFKAVHHADGSHFAVVSNGDTGYCVLGYSESGEHNSPANPIVITESNLNGNASCAIAPDASKLDWN